MYKIIKENSNAQIIEKKSKFIANIFCVESKEEAEEIIKLISKKYYDARHNCYAYRILHQGNIIEKLSDDGEPAGTAGNPILSIISKNNLINILVIVTRYFGGVLLGTGGLVRAYSQVAKNALEKTEYEDVEEGILYKMQIKYSDLENFKYFAKNNNLEIIKQNYLEEVNLEIIIPINKADILKSNKIGDFTVMKSEKIKRTYIRIT